MESYKVRNITLLETIVPEGSSGGTGYDEYARLLVSYEDGRSDKIQVGYYCLDLNGVFKQLYDSLKGCDNPAETYKLLEQAIGHLFRSPEFVDLATFADLPDAYKEAKPCVCKTRKIFRIRKLTERECLRLMGLSDEQIDLIANYPCIKDADGNWVLPEGMTEKEAKNLKISASQMYKMAGNSIVVPVLEGIFTQMFKAERDTLF